jgi:hypothetical protein
MKRILFIACLLAVVMVFCSSFVFAAEEGSEGKKAASAEKKIKGDLIPHPGDGDVKVLTAEFEAETIIVNDKTRIDASIKANLEDMSKESEFNLPKGEITYTIVDGKPVATRITYTSRETWKMEPPKPREE